MNTRRVSFLGMLTALAVALHLFEAQVPTPLPWVRLGLANLMTLLAVCTIGWRAGLIVTLLRIVIGSLLLGGFLTPAFLLSLGGGLTSTFVMVIMARGAWKLWSPLAVSVAGAFAHGGAQVFILAAVLIRTREALLILPWVLLPAVLSGIVTGILANLVLLRWQGYLRAALGAAQK